MSDEISNVNGTKTIQIVEPGIALAIAGIPVDLEKGQIEFTLNIREPGIVRAIGFEMLENGQLIVNPRRNGPNLRERLVMYIECDPAGRFRKRTFALLGTNATVSRGDGLRPKWRASGISPFSGLAGHVWELELDPAAAAIKLVPDEPATTEQAS